MSDHRILARIGFSKIAWRVFRCLDVRLLGGISMVTRVADREIKDRQSLFYRFRKFLQSSPRLSPLNNYSIRMVPAVGPSEFLFTGSRGCGMIGDRVRLPNNSSLITCL
jgi:hypothetical protein